jgi:hypothetical protein
VSVSPTNVLAVLLVVAAASRDARAQDADPAERPVVVTPGEEALLRSRNRAGLHPSNPLKIAGREQDGNDLRSKTPALQRGNTATASVDGDDAYARALAMVEERKSFEAPPVRANATPTLASEAAAARARRKAERASTAAQDGNGSSSRLPWVLGGFAAAAILVLGWITLRPRM